MTVIQTKSPPRKSRLSECYEMLDLCHTMVKASVKSLRHSETAEVAVDLYEMDKKLNAFERDVRRKVMTHLSLGHTADIGSGLTLVSIVIDMERIGDYTKIVCLWRPRNKPKTFWQYSFYQPLRFFHFDIHGIVISKSLKFWSSCVCIVLYLIHFLELLYMLLSVPPK